MGICVDISTHILSKQFSLYRMSRVVRSSNLFVLSLRRGKLTTLSLVPSMGWASTKYNMAVVGVIIHLSFIDQFNLRKYNDNFPHSIYF